MNILSTANNVLLVENETSPLDCGAGISCTLDDVESELSH